MTKLTAVQSYALRNHQTTARRFARMWRKGMMPTASYTIAAQ